MNADTRKCMDCGERPVYIAGRCETCETARVTESVVPFGVAARAAGLPMDPPYPEWSNLAIGWRTGWRREDKRIYNLPENQVKRSAEGVERARRNLAEVEAAHHRLVESFMPSPCGCAPGQDCERCKFP